MLLDVFIVVTTKLLLVHGVLEGCRKAVLISLVEICLPSGYGLTLVVVLGVRSTKGNIHREDGLRTVNDE